MYGSIDSPGHRSSHSLGSRRIRLRRGNQSRPSLVGHRARCPGHPIAPGSQNLLMAGFADEIAARLVADGIFTQATIYIGLKLTVPAGAGPFIQLVETGGSGPERTQNSVTKPAYVRPSMQLLITSSSQATNEAKAKAVYDSLVKVRNMTLSGTWYREINPDQEPFDFPLDGSQRPRRGFNISTIKRPS